MTRRNPSSQAGWVNFPSSDSEMEMTGEGGMFVTLIVYEDHTSVREDPNAFFKCCGGGSLVLQECEVLVAIVDCTTGEVKTSENRETFYGGVNVSQGLLAAVTLGTTGGSWGVAVDDGRGWENWSCQMSDLTDEGRELVATMRKLYPHAHLALLTHLDT